MKIETLQLERMGMTGSSILKALQNQSMSTIDLLIRESLQNSLDAYDKKNLNKYVEVRFNTGQFNSWDLNKELDYLGDSLNKKYKDNMYDYLCFEDRYTTGLDGEIRELSKTHAYGNFQKLVYEIAKPQTMEDAGGSWGYGKTIYFRVGIGLTVFYTRYKDKYGTYKDRLACTFIENEEKRDCLLKDYSSTYSGISWLGKKIPGIVHTVPEDDENYIRNFLRIFNVEKYEGNITGTKIIIPYIDKQNLLEDLDKRSDNDDRSNWETNFENALENAILTWYGPRMKKEYYKAFNRPYLQVSLNNKRIMTSEYKHIFFNLLQHMYALGIQNNAKQNGNVFSIQLDDEIELPEIHVKNVDYSNIVGIGGTIVFSKVNRRYFKNERTPYDYLHRVNTSSIGNEPIFCFCRKPGMIVDYPVSGDWCKTLSDTEEDEYLIAIFVLNSDASLKNGMSLESYIRHTEMADHTSWVDVAINQQRQGQIIATIKRNAQLAIRKVFDDDANNESSDKITGISQKLGRMFFPNVGSGRRPGPTEDGEGGGPVPPKVIHTKVDSLRLIKVFDNTAESVKLLFNARLSKGEFALKMMVSGEDGQKLDDFSAITIKKVVFQDISSKNVKYVQPGLVLDSNYREHLRKDIDLYLQDDYIKIVQKSNNVVSVQGILEVLINDRYFAFGLDMSKVKEGM